MNYVTYHLHTEDSLLDSCTNYKLYVDKAVELGQQAIAFTEHGNIYNHIEKKMYCNSKGLKYIHGVECYLTETLDEKIRDNYHTILLAKNRDGVKEINMLIDTSTKEDHMYYKPRISFEEFLNISDNVIKISACLASPLNKYDPVSSEEKDMYERLLRKYDYYEIQPHRCEEQILYNKMLYAFSQKYNKALIAGTDTHSLNKYKAECRSVLQKAKGIQYTDEDNFDLTYKSYNELVEMFNNQNALPVDVYLQAIENTNVMADSIDDYALDVSVKYPKLYDNEELVLNKLLAEKLKEKLNNGIIKKENIQKYKDSIIEEMRVFKKTNMIGFMLFMSELTRWCWDNGIPIGFCRGSVGGSVVAYITDIIDLDPIVWHTMFSRFCNEFREEVGDIDIDISPDQRSLVYEHIIKSFGYDKTAYILSLGTVQDKGTIDEIGRALNIPLEEVAHIKDLYSTYKCEIDTCNDKLKEEKDEASKKRIERQLAVAVNDMDNLKNNLYPNIFYYFDGLNGAVISQSYHPAGIIVSPITLPDNYGTFWNSEGKRIICINMEEVHEIGLVKYDLLGLKNVEIIRKTCEYAGIEYPKSYTLNWNDDKVWDDMTTSPVGVFQFESSYSFGLLKDYIPNCVNDMSMVNAALRPSGASYRDRLLAREENKNPSVIIDDLLKDNHGYLIFQEDTIKFLQNICGLSGSEADNVRRAIGRKQVDRLQKALPQILEGYCKMSPQPRAIAEEEAKTFLKIIEDSSRYQFGFNHSTGYSMIGYTCAYLRYYYPEEFITAYLNCAGNTDDISNGTALSKIKNIKINNIKFGKSKSEYIVDKVNHAIYKGIASIKFCNKQIADELYQLGQNKYDNFIELLKDIDEKTSVNSRQLHILTILNFFSDFGNNKYLLNIIDLYDKFGACKILKKEKLEQLNISQDAARKYSEKETEKQFSKIDNEGLIKCLAENIENNSLSIKEQMKSEMEYLEYITYINPKAPDNMYYVTECKFYKDKTKPYLNLYNLKNGEYLKTKITSGKSYIEKPFDKGSIIVVKEFSNRDKMKMINGSWTKTGEQEKIVKAWNVY